MSTVTTVLLKQYEREILSMILGDKLGNKDSIINSLLPEMFTQSFHRTVFEVCQHLKNTHQEVNKFAIMEIIGNEEQAKVIEQIYDEFVGNVNYAYFVKKLQNAYIDRLIKEASSTADLEKIQEVRDFCADASSIVHISDGAERLICDYYEKQENAVLTGYKSIDSKIGSLFGGDYIVIAGATSMGKTCFALNLLRKMAERNTKCLVFSYEMGKASLQNRLICSETGIGSWKFRAFSLNANEQNKYQEAAENLKYFPIYLCTDPNVDMEKMRKICKKSDADVFFIDYLGLIPSKRKRKLPCDKNACERNRQTFYCSCPA